MHSRTFHRIRSAKPASRLLMGQGMLPAIVWAIAAHLLSEPARAAEDWNVFPATPLVDLANGVPNSPGLNRSLHEAAALVATWKEPATAAEWDQRRRLVEQDFRRAIGLEQLPERTALNVRAIATNSFSDYQVETLTLESRPGFPITADLYRPAKHTIERLPAVLSPIGHFLTPGKTAPEVQARCIGLARRGFTVLVYDAIGQGERMTPGNIHHDAGYALLPLGETIAGWMVWDSMRLIDYLLTRDDVDGTRIGLTGNSGGGLNTLFTAALDARVQASVIAGFTFEFANWVRYGGAHCTCTHLPGVFRHMNWFEIASLIAPRAVMMIQGANDGIFPISGARASGAAVEHVYRLGGHSDLARFVELPGQPHAYSRPFREHLYGWMAAHLQGEGRGEPLRESEIQPLPERDPRLLCDAARTSLPTVPTVVDLARRKAWDLLGKLPDPSTPLGRDAVLSWARELVVPPDPQPHFLSARTHRQINSAGASLEKISFNSQDGERIPGLLWRPRDGSAKAQTVVIVDARGKAAVAESGLTVPLLESGYTVLAIDLRGRGETLGRYGPTYDTNFRLVANQVLLGQPLAGRRAFDLVRALDYLASRPDLASNRVTVVGSGDDALPALLAAASDPRIHQLAISGSVHSFISQIRARTPPPSAKMGEAWNDPQLRGRVNAGDLELDFGSVIPGALLHADLPDLTALIAPRKVLFCQARDHRDPDAKALAERYQATVRSRGANWLEYAPGQVLDGRLLVDWIKQDENP